MPTLYNLNTADDPIMCMYDAERDLWLMVDEETGEHLGLVELELSS